MTNTENRSLVSLGIGDRVEVDGMAGTFEGYSDDEARDGAGPFVLVRLDDDAVDDPDHRVSRWHPARVRSIDDR